MIITRLNEIVQEARQGHVPRVPHRAQGGTDTGAFGGRPARGAREGVREAQVGPDPQRERSRGRTESRPSATHREPCHREMAA